MGFESLFPRPRSWVPASGTASASLAVEAHRASELAAEHFEIEIAARSVVVRHADANALRYAEDVLDRLRAPDGSLPCGRLEDGPDLPVRGYMLRVPIIGSIIRLLGFFDADAGDAATVDAMYRAAEEATARGGGLLFYPEGTRSRGGEIGPFRRGAFRLAVDRQLPIQPVAIVGLDVVYPPGQLLSPVRGRHPVRIRYLEPLHPPYGEGARRDVVRSLAERVLEALVKDLALARTQR